MSNKKSRDNLRRAKEAKETKEVSTPKEEAPVVKAPEEVVTVAPQESKLKEEIITYVEEPLPIAQAAPTPVPEEVHVEESAAQKAHASALEKLQQNKIEQLTSPSHSSLATSASNESVKQVQFATEEDKVDLIKPQVEITGPERPSSMVAKRASMVGNRRRSLHESYAADKYNQDMQRHGANKTAGLVSNSIKQWDDILKPEESVIPPASHRRSLLRQLRQEQEQPEEVPDKSNAVLDKVLKFERASSLDDAVHQKVSHMPRRERFLYLQQDPSAIERKSTIAAAKKKLTTRRVAVDQAVQTDPIEVQEDIKSDDDKSDAKSVEEEGIVDGDEEWFLQDDEWDEQEETAIVEWLLCD
jgi:hypothetical protein